VQVSDHASRSKQARRIAALTDLPTSFPEKQATNGRCGPGVESSDDMRVHVSRHANRCMTEPIGDDLQGYPSGEHRGGMGMTQAVQGDPG
jgi:hypothetical protein